MIASPPLRFRQIFFQRELRLPGLVMFGRYQYAAAQSGLLPHSHPNAIEICFLERGEQTYRVGGCLYRLRGNDQFLTLPGEVHDTARLPQERGILYWLILKLEPAGKCLGLSETMARRLTHELWRMPTRHFRAHPDCSRLLGQMRGLLSKRKPGSFSAFRLLRLQTLLLEYLTLTIESSHRSAQESVTPLIRRVLRHIEQRLEEPIQVAKLAGVARLSESRFKTRFKRETGVPPAEFWLRKKIERAASLLETHSVTEVAYALGFSSSQYFATAFKRYTLFSPRNFMAQVGRSVHPTRGRFAGRSGGNKALRSMSFSANERPPVRKG